MTFLKYAYDLLHDLTWFGTIIAAFVTFIATMISIFAGNLYTEYLKKRARRLELAIARVDDQISKFYAPLSILITQLREIDKTKNKIINEDLGHKDEIEKLLHSVYFSPIHDKINAIVQTQMHLLEGKDIPDSFDDYYKHVASERVLYSIRQKIEEKRGSDPVPITFTVSDFPEDFEKEIIKGLRTAQTRQEMLLSKLDRRRTYG